MRRVADMTGQRFGILTVTGFSHQARQGYWICACECGGRSTVRRGDLITGRTKSCGCLSGVRHGGSSFPEYGNWAHMIRRTKPNPEQKYQRNYADRGITVCDRWKVGENGVAGFACFLNDMGRRPTPLHSIDRIDNNGNYEPQNCRWALPKEQSRNQRKTLFVDFNGRRYPVAEAAERFATVKKGQVVKRLKSGWTPEQALKIPNRRKSTVQFLGLPKII